MGGVKISQIRWPIEVYEWLINEAYERHQSLNKTVNDLIVEARTQREALSLA